MTRRLIITGDDLGLHAAIDAGIFAAFERGLLTRASLLVTGPTAGEAAARAGELGLPVGVHLALLDVPPAAAGRGLEALIEAGRFRASGPAVALARVAAVARPAPVRIEWEAQLRRAEQLGLRVNHLDGHAHVHLWPTLFPVAVELARRHGVTDIRTARGARGAKGALLRGMTRASLARCSLGGLSTADRLLGVERTGSIDRRWLQAALSRLPSGTFELLVHPATPHGGAPWPDTFDRAAELDALLACRLPPGVVACSHAGARGTLGA